MSLFDDLIPKAQPPGPSIPSDPRGPTATMPQRPVRAGSIGYGPDRRLPSGSTPAMATPEAPSPSFDSSRLVAQQPTIPDQMLTPTLAELMSGGGRDFTSQDRSAVQSRLRGIVDEESTPSLSNLMLSFLGGIEQEQFASPVEAERYITDPQNWQRGTEEVVTNKPGTALSRLFGMDDGIPDATEMRPTGPYEVRMPQGAPSAAVTAPPAGGQPDPVAILNEAREAIRIGRDPEAVAARLREMGIDPSQL